jgi:hypothetical protein
MWKLTNPPRCQGTHKSLVSLFSCKEMFCSRGGLLWICCAVFSVSLLLLQCFVIDNDVLKSVTAFLLSSTLYFAISFWALRVADYNEARTARNNRHDMYSGEVQFVGSNREPPYLSQGGRWSHYRRTYVRLFIGGVTYGSFFLITASHFAASHVLKSFLLLVGSGILFFALTGLVAVTAIVNRYRDRLWQDQRNFLACFFWSSLIGSLGVGLIALQDDENQRHEAGAILLIGCCISWIAVFLIWCSRDVFEGWIHMVAMSVYTSSWVFLLCLGRDSYAFDTCWISFIVIFSLAAQVSMQYSG